MNKIIKLFLATCLITLNSYSQDTGLGKFFLKDASIGLNSGAFMFTSDGSDIGVSAGFNYSKQLSSVMGLQLGYVSSTLSNETVDLPFDALFIRGLLNLSNLTIGNSDNSKIYAGFGTSLMTFEDDGSALIPNFGAGVKLALSEKIDLDISSMLGTTPLSGDDLASHLNFGISLNYRFTKKESSVEWNNPLDALSNDLASVKTKIEGLSSDTDGDGVSDSFDADNNTPKGVVVDGKGVALDVDMDGVADFQDDDPFTPRGVQVDANGRELDSDKDGVPNSVDIEPNTPLGVTVNFQGKEIRGAKGAFMPAIYFDFNSTKVSYANYERLAAVAALLQANLNYKLKVIGYADSVGNNSNNMKVAMNRANAVIEILNTVFNIDKSRLTPESKGEESPLANESVKMTQKSSDGQVISNSLNRMNRRVEFVIQ